MSGNAKRMRVVEDTGGGENSVITQRTTIQDLPDEIVVEIFSYVSKEHLLLSVSKVCERWNELHRDPSLYRSLVFTQFDPETSLAVSMIKRARWLKILKLTKRNDTNKILENVSVSDNNLETLVVRECHGTKTLRNISSVGLRNVLENCRKLKHVSLKGSCCTCREFHEEIGLRLKKLTAIDFGKARNFSTAALTNVADNCKSIEHFRAHRFNEVNTYPYVSDAVVATLCDKFGRSLRTVKINCAFCTDAGFTSLSTCHNLTKLNLHNARCVTDPGITALGDIANLAKLTMWDANLVTSAGWIQFLNKPLMRRIKSLILYYCENINDDVCSGMSITFDEMRVLKLLGCKITEEGFLQVTLCIPPRCKCSVSNGIGSWFWNYV